MFEGFELWLRTKLPFVKNLYVKLKLGNQENPYTMWFKVVGKTLTCYNIVNRNHYSTTQSGQVGIISANDPQVLEWCWSTDDRLLAPTKLYEKFVEQAEKDHYYPTQFTVLNNVSLIFSVLKNE